MSRSRRTSSNIGELVVEDYLLELGLQSLLADHLERRLDSAKGVDERISLAERLGSVYVELLERTDDPDARAQLEARSRELLQSVPEADSFELRINLLKALYQRAERLMELARLRLVTEEERAEAESTLRTLRPAFEQIASKVHRRAELLESREENGDESLELTRQLGKARQLRSLAFYYAGWTSYYMAWSANSGSPCGGCDEVVRLVC